MHKGTLVGGSILILVTVSLLVLICRPNPDPKRHTETSTTSTPISAQFGSACYVHPGEREVRCDPLKLTEVLETLAAESKYDVYRDPETGLSFEYPSSVAVVTKEEIADVVHVGPLIPATLGTEYWSGISISVENCDGTCTTDLGSYVQNWHYPGTVVQPTVKIISAHEEIGKHVWVKAGIADTFGGAVVLYVTSVKGKIVSIVSDINSMQQYQPNIYSAFRKVIESIE